MQKAHLLNAPIHFADKLVNAKFIRADQMHSDYDVYQGELLSYPNLKVNLLGHYQKQNLQTIIQSLEVLPAQFKPDLNSIRKGLAEIQKLTNFIGRWQVLQQKPLIISDSAHNLDGVQQIVQQLQSTPYRQLHIVLGMVKEKDHVKVLELLPKEAIYYFAKPQIPRGLDANLLRSMAIDHHLQGEAFNSVTIAIERAKYNAQEDDLIFIGGSVFVVAEALEELEN